MKLQRRFLKDIATFSNGINFDKSAYGEGVKIINVSDFGELFSPNYELLSEVKKEYVRKNDYLYNGDIVFVRSNGNKELIGRCMLINKLKEPITYSGFCIRCRITELNLYNPVYLTYYFKSESFRRVLTGNAVGANIQNLSQSRLSNVILAIPSIEKQNRIADILSAYDNLIENNQKQIKLLEEAAQRLYKEWFVDLRFPGYETTPIVDGLPEGWKKKKLIDIADIQYGYAFDGSLFSTDKSGTPIVRIRNIPIGNTNDYTSEIADNQYLVYNGDIVVGMDGEFHINSWCGKTAYLVQRTCRIKPKQENAKGWLFQAIYSPIKYYEKTIVGATVAHLGKKHLDSIELLVGTENLYIPFQNIFEKRQILLNQNNELKEARDRLLPKLMNGEIEV